MAELNELEQRIGVSFERKELLQQALTHRSYLNEDRRWSVGHNERLEFLGDTVVDMLVAHYLFQHFPEKTEGMLSRAKSNIVSNINLGRVGKKLGLLDHLKIARGTRAEPRNALHHIASSTYEALIGAVYLDRGVEAARGVVESTLFGTELDDTVDQQDPKGLLQQLTQAQWGVAPTYITMKLSGAEHRPRFVARAYLKGSLIGAGGGTSEKQATAAAAQEALTNRGWEQKLRR
ncbi:MAG: ribonuclease III [Candidatus Wildermuthbacteria bacterium]|nr:ribonuclease III [Candidatus Wildermuthbacteria bacterium]